MQSSHESENFSDYSLHHIFESENFRFPFFLEMVKCEKLNSRKPLGIFWISFKNIVHEWDGLLEIFSCPQVIENSRQYSLLRTDILKKTGSLGALVIFEDVL